MKTMYISMKAGLYFRRFGLQWLEDFQKMLSFLKNDHENICLLTN